MAALINVHSFLRTRLALPPTFHSSHLRCSPSSDTVGTSASTVSTLNSLVSLGDSGVLSWAESLDTWESSVAVTALWCRWQLLDVKVPELATWSLDDPSSVGLCVVWRPLSESETLGHLWVGG